MGHQHDRDDNHADPECDIEVARETGFEDGKALLASKIDEIWPKWGFDPYIAARTGEKPPREYKAECRFHSVSEREMHKHMTPEEATRFLRQVRALIDEIL